MSEETGISFYVKNNIGLFQIVDGDINSFSIDTPDSDGNATGSVFFEVNMKDIKAEAFYHDD